MSADVGMKAPVFSLKDKGGRPHSLEDFKSECLVVYFYPRDSTPGCTIEAKGFTRDLEKFREAGTEIIGISGGDEKTKTKFCNKHGLGVLLLSDPGFTVSKKYGAYGEKSFMGRKFQGIHRRTFVLDRNRTKIKVFEKPKVISHSREVLDFIKGLK